jgi:hypothetical protein
VTIAVAVRTGSAVVFAADSKVSTRGIAGLDKDGTPIWVDQTYDNATKVAHDRASGLMVMVAGSANVGQIAATDFVRGWNAPFQATQEEQENQVRDLVATMVAEKRRFWEKQSVAPDTWPGPSIFMASSLKRGGLRVWSVGLEGEASSITEVLTDPGVRLDGSYVEVFSLLNGFDPHIMREVGRQLGADEARVLEALRNAPVLRPADQINFYAMPLQDAMDLAVFLASVQIQMDRFTPGTPACGGPIDLMVLQSVPDPRIDFYPGKTLHHPNSRGNV